MSRLATRTVQELLIERRANVLEMMRERDEMARAMLAAHIELLDAELNRRRGRGEVA